MSAAAPWPPRMSSGKRSLGQTPRQASPGALFACSEPPEGAGHFWRTFHRRFQFQHQGCSVRIDQGVTELPMCHFFEGWSGISMLSFRHDRNLSERFLELFDGGKLLFPPDPLAEVATETLNCRELPWIW